LIAVAGGAFALRLGASIDFVFVAASVGMATFGCLALPGLILRSGFGDWPTRIMFGTAAPWAR
jgi:hypothetical protein